MILIIVMGLMAATLLVLIVGISLMMRGGETNEKYSNKLMTARVILQGLTIAVLGIMFLMSGK